MNPQRFLLLTLKYKKLNRQLDKEVKLNFGYSPSSEYFDRLLKERNDIYEELTSAGYRLSDDEKYWI